MGKRKSKFGQDLVDIYGVPEAICSIFHPSSIYAQLQVLLVHPEYLKVNIMHVQAT